VDVQERRRGERRRSVAPVSTTSRAAALAELMNRAGEQNARTERTAGAEEAGLASQDAARPCCRGRRAAPGRAFRPAWHS